MVDTDGMDFGLKVLDAQAAFPLSTEFRLARLFKQTQTVNRYNKNLYKKHGWKIIRLHIVFLVNQNLSLENI